MQTRDKIIRKTAKDLGISIRAAESVIRAQCMLIKKTMRAKEPRSIYLRGVGMFMPRVISQKIAKAKKEFIKQKYNKDSKEDPLEF